MAEHGGVCETGVKGNGFDGFGGAVEQFPLRLLQAKRQVAFSDGGAIQLVSNILGVKNDVPADSPKLGGYAEQSYDYANLYRLVAARGIYCGGKLSDKYSLKMSYDNLYDITEIKLGDSMPFKSYRHFYSYYGAAPIKDKSRDRCL
ncbi:hypothetical protein [Foetidibacter luteolus]|uniref:hypothetical protein n=1 Tax=Foetidibacter luteolus TaxID=2608880 RepID=UPI00129BF947|nr:hypothetical protein [Foetidibacter luteolus]